MRRGREHRQKYLWSSGSQGLIEEAIFWPLSRCPDCHLFRPCLLSCLPGSLVTRSLNARPCTPCAQVTKHIRVRASGGSAEESELASFTPAFLWLLRDFYLRLEEDGRSVTPRDYLETALQTLPGTGRAVEAKNQVGAPRRVRWLCLGMGQAQLVVVLDDADFVPGTVVAGPGGRQQDGQEEWSTSQ